MSENFISFYWKNRKVTALDTFPVLCYERADFYDYFLHLGHEKIRTTGISAVTGLCPWLQIGWVLHMDLKQLCFFKTVLDLRSCPPDSSHEWSEKFHTNHISN